MKLKNGGGLHHLHQRGANTATGGLRWWRLYKIEAHEIIFLGVRERPCSFSFQIPRRGMNGLLEADTHIFESWLLQWSVGSFFISEDALPIKGSYYCKLSGIVSGTKWHRKVQTQSSILLHLPIFGRKWNLCFRLLGWVSGFALFLGKLEWFLKTTALTENLRFLVQKQSDLSSTWKSQAFFISNPFPPW